MRSGRRRAWIVFVVLVTTLAGRVPLAQAQAQAQKGPTLGGHIGFVLPMVTHSGGQTTNDLTDAFALDFRLELRSRVPVVWPSTSNLSHR
jgi:hypothetical protein